MRTPKAIISAAACCAAVVSPAIGFQPGVRIIPARPTGVPSLRSHHVDGHDELSLEEEDCTGSGSGPLGGNTSEAPRSLGPKRTFLGMRREGGAMRRLMEQQRLADQSVNRGTTTALSNSATALMPDGGLSPCVIKVLGVGGGGSNAVRFFIRVGVLLLLLALFWLMLFCSWDCHGWVFVSG